jgi:hypothetical protein
MKVNLSQLTIRFRQQDRPLCFYCGRPADVLTEIRREPLDSEHESVFYLPQCWDCFEKKGPQTLLLGRDRIIVFDPLMKGGGNEL